MFECPFEFSFSNLVAGRIEEGVRFRASLLASGDLHNVRSSVLAMELSALALS